MHIILAPAELISAFKETLEMTEEEKKVLSQLSHRKKQQRWVRQKERQGEARGEKRGHK